MKSHLLVFFSLISTFTQAQLCSGSLGEPTAQVTFGTNSNPAIISGNTLYKKNNGSCPNPGEYILVPITFNCFGGSWHTLAGDHTHDGNGLFMLINAASTAGEVFRDTAYNLCNGIIYQFSFWIANMSKPSACGASAVNPNLSFTLTTPGGQILGQATTGDIIETDKPEWREFGVSLQLPVGVSSVIFKITENNAGGCGNAFAMDDIAFRPCGPLTNSEIVNNGGTSITLCQGDNITIQLHAQVSSGYSNPVYQWQMRSDQHPMWADISGQVGIDYFRPASSPGEYRYRLKVMEASTVGSPNCGVYSNELTVTVAQTVFAQATHYVYGCLGGAIQLDAAGGSIYHWTGPNGFVSDQQRPILSPLKYSDAGKYYVLITTFAGCSNMDSTDLQVKPNAVASAANGGSICEGSSVTLHASGGLTYRWSPTSTLSNDTIADPVARPTETTRYKVSVYNQYNCEDSTHITIVVWKKPKANAGPSKKTMVPYPVMLEGIAQGTDVHYFWTPAITLNNDNILKPLATPSDNTFYTLHVVSEHGCGTSTSDVYVKVIKDIFIPNAFSPNGDGINDVWRIEALEILTDAKVQVFNRYGQMIFSSKGPDWWNGTYHGNPVPVGTYYYYIDLKVLGKQPLTGSVTIIR